jgi:ribose transport system substrate-binding protein
MNHGKLIAVCFCLALTVFHLGCAEQKARTATATTTKPKIALIMKSLANEFFSTMAEGAKKHQEAHADQYDLVVNGIPDERDISRQVALV